MIRSNNLEKRLDFLAHETIGVIGCGHLGKTIASELVRRGFPAHCLMLSRGRSHESMQGIIDAGLEGCLSDNQDICRKCSIIFIAIRPQSLPDLRGLAFPEDALVVSCMAGVSLPAIKGLLGVDAVRIMPSGPDTIREGKGIAAIYPHNQILPRILRELGLRVFELKEEEQIHIFTVGVCLPAAILALDDGKDAIEEACRCLSRVYPDFPEICSWSRDVLPEFEREEDKRDYIRKMATRGGITEAVVKSLERGDDLLLALKQGIKRSREISLCYEKR